MYAVRLQGLTKDFKSGFWRSRRRRALDAVTLDVEGGEVLGYLGPNGSGKTTTLKLLMQLIFPSSGAAQILGRPVGDLSVRRRIGFLPENPSFYNHLTADQLLQHFARLFGCDRRASAHRAGVLLDRVGIGDERGLHLRKLSKGMLQRVGIAQALVNDPEVVFLDEPMAGLDPIGRAEMRNLMLSLRDEGRTLFFSSHILTDAEAICTHVAILSKGRLIASGKIEDIGLEVRGWELVVTDMPADRVEVLRPDVSHITRIAEARYVIRLPVDRRPEPMIADLAGYGAKVVSLNPHHETLEEYFVAQVARQQRAEEGQRASA